MMRRLVGDSICVRVPPLHLSLPLLDVLLWLSTMVTTVPISVLVCFKGLITSERRQLRDKTTVTKLKSKETKK